MLFNRHAVTSRIGHEILAIDEAEASQFVEQREVMRRIAWTGVQTPKAINPSGFLCTCPGRACHNAAEQHDEFAPSHCFPQAQDYAS